MEEFLIALTIMGLGLIAITIIMYIEIRKKSDKSNLWYEIKDHHKVSAAYNLVDKYYQHIETYACYSRKTNTRLSILEKKVIDLTIGKQKPKFKKGDNVRDSSSSIITYKTDNLPRINCKVSGEYVCREIDYKRGEWVAKVLVGCEVMKVDEEKLTKVEKNKK